MRPIGLAAALLAATLLAASAGAQPKTLKIVPSADVTVLDPMFGTAWISLIHGMMVYESLFTWDSKLAPQPMMAQTWSTAPDGLSWTFVLRPGLTFHDGSPVTSADVVASTKRWVAVDSVGAKVGAVLAGLEAPDPRTVVFRLTKPYPGMLTALAAAPARFPAIMRARDVDPLPAGQVTNAIGSGPFRFVHAERIAGARAVYERNPAYTPRAEPPDGPSGARLVKVDRVEWHVIPDAATATAALQAGEVDVLERPVLDTVALLRRTPGITVRKTTEIAGQSMLRPNATLPPFNNPKARLALAYVINQEDEMAAGWGEPENWRTCNAYFVCGGPYGTEVGAEGFKQDFARARALLAEAGYKGEKLTFVSTKEIATLGQMAEVAHDALKRAGLNVEMVWADWGTVGQLLRKRDGWNLFLTGAPGPITFHPLTNVGTDMSCDGRNFVGWPCDEEAERLRTAFLEAPEPGRKTAIEALHRRLAEVQPYRVLGQYDQLMAHRNNVRGVLDSPILLYWNLEK